MISLRLLQTYSSRSLLAAAFAIAPVACLTISGCKTTPTAPDDTALSSSLNRQLSSDTAINNQPIQGTVQNGVATLTGSVNSDAQRTIAARDAAGIQGVKAVQNNLTIAPAAASASTTPILVPVPVPATRSTGLIPTGRPDDRSSRLHDQQIRDQQTREDARRADLARQQANNNSPRQPAPVVRTTQPTPAQPVTPPAPQFRTITVPAGSTFVVRMTQTLDSATTQEGAPFSGSLASDILADGVVALPAGSGVSGHVDTVHEAGHFEGNSLLTVSLNGLRARGERLPLTSEPYTVSGKGRGKNTAEKAGIGAVGGAILGGILGGGKGAAIGAAAGGAGGAGINAVTRGQQVTIPSESIIRFRSTNPITVRVQTDGGANRNSNSGYPAPRQDTNGYPAPRQNDNGDPTLQRRPPQN